ncbi:MAG: hypothetical protein ABH827_06385 [bacterium]
MVNNILFLKKIFWSLLGVIVFNFCTCFAFNDASEMTDYFEPYTQTGAYLRNGKETHAFLDAFFRKVTDYYAEKKYDHKFDVKLPQDKFFEDVVKRFAKLENFYGKTHHVFYHGTHAFYIFIQDVMRVFLKVFFEIDLPEDLAILRIPYKEFKDYANVDELISAGKHFDGGAISRKLCLSAGPTPFTCACSCPSECPMNYFLVPNIGGGAQRLMGSLSTSSVLKEVFDFFGLGDYFPTHGVKLLKMIEGSDSRNPIKKYLSYDDNWMIQVFIPVSKTNKYVWNADPGGCGGKSLLVKKIRLHADCTACDDVFCEKRHECPYKLYDKESEITVAEFLNLYKKDREKAFLYAPCNYYSLACALDRLQVRIYLAPNVFHNPASGIKIFRHVRKQKDKKMEKNYFKALELFARSMKQSSQCSIL